MVVQYYTTGTQTECRLSEEEKKLWKKKIYKPNSQKVIIKLRGSIKSY